MQVSKNKQHFQTLWGSVCVAIGCLSPLGLVFLFSFFRVKNVSLAKSIWIPLAVLNFGLSLATFFSVLSPQPNLLSILKDGSNSIIASEQVASWRSSLVTPIAKDKDPTGLGAADCFRLSGERANFILYTVATHKLSQNISASIYLKTLQPNVTNAGLRIEERLKEGSTKVVELSNQWQRYELSYKPETAINPTLILFNPPGSADLDLCAWGAQIEEASAASRYLSIKDEIQLHKATLSSKLSTILQIQVAMFLFLSLMVISKALSPQMLYWGCLSAFLIQALYAIIQKLFYLERSQGFSFQPNVLAAQTILVFTFLFMKSSSWQIRLGFSVLSIICIWTTGSRLALVLLLAMLVLFLYKDFVKVNYRRPQALVVLVIMGIALTLQNSRLFSLNPLADPRLDILSALIRVFLDYPWFGWGLATSQKVLILGLWPMQPRFFAHTHNLIAELLLSVGVLGFLFIVCFVLNIVRDLLAKNANLSLILLLVTFILNFFDLTLLHSAIYVPLILLVVLDRNREVQLLS